MTGTDIVRGDTITFGHPGAYGLGKCPTGTWVTILGETFIEVTGDLYTVCGYCGDPVPGVKSYYGHVMGGVCFQCNGAGVRRKVGGVEEATRIAKRRIRDRQRAAEKRSATEEAAKAALAAWAEEHADLAARLGAIREELTAVDGLQDYGYRSEVEQRYGPFVVDMAWQAGHSALTDKQVVAVAGAIEKADLWAAERQAAQEASRWLGQEKDKVEVRGIVRRWVAVEDYYSHHGGTKALVIVEGIGEHTGVTLKMVGTARTLYDCGKGDEVLVAGTVKKHEEYEGVKQTQLIRPKVSVLTPAQEA